MTSPPATPEPAADLWFPAHLAPAHVAPAHLAPAHAEPGPMPEPDRTPEPAADDAAADEPEDRGPVGAAEREALAQRLVGQARDLVLSVPRPGVPLETEWKAGLGHLVRAAPRFPTALSRFLGRLDKLAEVRLTPDLIAFDGQEAAWQEVTEVRLASVVDVLSEALLDKEIDRITAALPPFPGRKWALRRLTQVVTGLAAAAVESAAPTDGEPLLVTACVVHKGRFGRRREIAPGLFAAAVCVAIPEVTAAVRDAAGRHGVPVVLPEPRPGTSRRVQEVAASLRAKLRKDVAD